MAALSGRRVPGSRLGLAALLWLVLCLIPGCQAPKPLHPPDISEPGWRLYRGQALWKPGAGSAQLAGDLAVAVGPEGRCSIQFIKEPFPLVTAQRDGERWTVAFVPRRRVLTGSSSSEIRFVWFQLPRIAADQPAAAPWIGLRKQDRSFRLSNPTSGETLEGFLSP